VALPGDNCHSNTGTGSTATIRKQDGGALASSPSGRGSFQFPHRVQWVNLCKPVPESLHSGFYWS